MLEALFLLPEGGLLRLPLPLAGLDQGFSALDFLLRPGLSSGHRVRPFLEFLGFLCARRLGFLERRLARFDVLQVREERGLLFLQGGLQRLVRLRFLRERSLGGGDLALASFELASLGGVLFFKRGPSRPQVSLDDFGRVGPFCRAFFGGCSRLLSLLNRGFAAFCRGPSLFQPPLGRLYRPRAPLGGFFLNGQPCPLPPPPRAVARQRPVPPSRPS